MELNFLLVCFKIVQYQEYVLWTTGLENVDTISQRKLYKHKKDLQNKTLMFTFKRVEDYIIESKSDKLGLSWAKLRTKLNC